jgi:transposase-like protein
VGVAPGVLYAWKHRLQRNGVRPAKPAPRKAKFVEVEVVATEARVESTTIEIVLGNGLVVRVAGGVEVLAAVLRAAEGLC